MERQTRLYILVFGIAFCGFNGISLVDSSLLDNATEAAYLLDKLYKVDARLRPGVYGDPTIVGIDFYVQSFGPLKETEMEFNLEVVFRISWNDSRLIYDTNTPDIPMFIPPKHIDLFWLPDVYFPNDKSGKLHDMTIINRSIRIFSNGLVRYLARMALVISCPLNLRSFPHDRQNCSLRISTYSYDSNQIILTWNDDDPIEIKYEELNQPQFALLEHMHGYCQESYKTGNFSCLEASFVLKRKIGFFILQAYLPSMLIVFLSWVAFWINKKAEPARVTLGVTTVLTMTTQLTTSRSNSMQVSYPKAIDIWYSACMIFVFGSLVEYAMVNINLRLEHKRTERRAKKAASGKDLEKAEEEDNAAPLPKRKFATFMKMLKRATAQDIDHVSRISFPICFLIFNLVYWLVVIHL